MLYMLHIYLLIVIRFMPSISPSGTAMLVTPETQSKGGSDYFQFLQILNFLLDFELIDGYCIII